MHVAIHLLAEDERFATLPNRLSARPGGNDMSFIIYLIGFAFIIGGIACALVVAKVSTLYVMIAVVILIGVAILTGVTRTRTKD